MGLAFFGPSITHMGNKSNFYNFFLIFDKISPFEIGVYLRQGKAGLVWERQML